MAGYEQMPPLYPPGYHLEAFLTAQKKENIRILVSTPAGTENPWKKHFEQVKAREWSKQCDDAYLCYRHLPDAPGALGWFDDADLYEGDWHRWFEEKPKNLEDWFWHLIRCALLAIWK